MASAANRGFMSNAGFVVTDDGVVVFDALGTPVLGRAMVDAIRKVTPLPIRRVIVSHYHADHVYGLQALKEAGAEIWAYRKGEAYFTSGVGRGAARATPRRSLSVGRREDARRARRTCGSTATSISAWAASRSGSSIRAAGTRPRT